MTDAREILVELSQIKNGDYTQNGTLLLCQAIAASGDYGLVWHALSIAHYNGMRQVADSQTERAVTIKENASMATTLHIGLRRGED